MIAISLLAAFAALLSACTTSTALTPSKEDLDAKAFVVPDGKARIYVTRPGHTGWAELTEVVVDGVIVAALSTYTYVMIDVDPGKHAIAVPELKGQNVLTVQADAGKIYFFRIANYGRLGPDTDEEGRRAVLATSRAVSYVP